MDLLLETFRRPAEADVDRPRRGAVARKPLAVPVMGGTVGGVMQPPDDPADAIPSDLFQQLPLVVAVVLVPAHLLRSRKVPRGVKLLTAHSSHQRASHQRAVGVD